MSQPKWEETNYPLTKTTSKTIIVARVNDYRLRIIGHTNHKNPQYSRWVPELTEGGNFICLGDGANNMLEAKREAVGLLAEHLDAKEQEINRARKGLLRLSDGTVPPPVR